MYEDVIARLRGYLYEEEPADPDEARVARSLLEKLEVGRTDFAWEEEELLHYLESLGSMARG